MTDKPKPWFRLKLRDDAGLPRYDSMLSKTEIEVMPDQKWLRSEFFVYGASPMIMAFPDVKKVKLEDFYND